MQAPQYNRQVTGDDLVLGRRQVIRHRVERKVDHLLDRQRPGIEVARHVVEPQGALADG